MYVYSEFPSKATGTLHPNATVSSIYSQRERGATGFLGCFGLLGYNMNYKRREATEVQGIVSSSRSRKKSLGV